MSQEEWEKLLTKIRNNDPVLIELDLKHLNIDVCDIKSLLEVLVNLVYTNLNFKCGIGAAVIKAVAKTLKVNNATGTLVTAGSFASNFHLM